MVNERPEMTEEEKAEERERELRQVAKRRYQAQNNLSDKEVDKLWAEDDQPVAGDPSIATVEEPDDPVNERDRSQSAPLRNEAMGENLEGHTIEELRQMADDEDVELRSDMRKADIIAAIQESRIQ